MANIDSSIQYLKGVGPAFAKKFEKLGIATIRDLLLCYPRKYIDYTQPYTVASAPYDVDCCIRATVLQKEPARRIKGGRVLSRVLAADDSGVLALSWFNASYAADKLIAGQTYYFQGRVGGSMTHRELLHPLVRTEAQVAASPFVAVYRGTEGLPAARQAACAQAALAYVGELKDPLSPALLTRYRMPAKSQAVRAIHAPKDSADLAAARRRLIFEELYLLQIGIFLLRSHGRRETSAPMRALDLTPFWRSLPYAPTGAQRRAAEEIARDLCGTAPMNRLLQGDVGSGKTLVAAAAIWYAAQNGWQSAMLAPTEILARQHAATLADRLRHAILPALALSITGTASVCLHTRQKTIQALESDFVLFARARGESGKGILLRHVLRHVLLPAITLQFASLGELLGSSVLVEEVFSYPGLGQATVTAGLGGDLPLLLGITVICCAMVFGANFAADCLYGLVDPRIRKGADRA